MGGSVSLIDGHIDEPTPCENCETRKVYFMRLGTHWHNGDDCPFECPKWKEWKGERE